MVEVFLHRTFAEAQIEGDLLICLRFGDESYDLLFTEREGVARSMDRPAPGLAAGRTSVLSSASVKTAPATSATPGHGCEGGHRNIRFLHD